jgi:molybdopterin converting factor small subunit
MATLRLFASVRVAAGTGRADIDGATVGEVVDRASERYGAEFAGLLQSCRVWRNGEPAEREDPVGPDDEVAILPPVSGG